MIKIGVLHEIMAHAMDRAHRQRMGNLQLAFGAKRPRQFMEQLQSTPVDAILVSLDLLGDRPIESLRRMQSLAQPQVIIVSYFFTRSSILNELRTTSGIHPLRSPITIEAVRAELDSLRVESSGRQAQPTRNEPKTETKSEARNEKIRVASPQEQVNEPQPTRRFSDRQITHLQGVRSKVECECPQHISALLASLNSFEEYARECGNMNETDAKIHGTLYRATGHARAMVEEATRQLCRYEGIEVDN